MPDYRYVIVDASLGKNLAEVPLDQVTFSRILNGVGELSGTLSLDHPAAIPAIIDGDREVTVYRDDVAVWNGPIGNRVCDLAQRTATITAREASWYLSKRTLEVDKTYTSQDLFTIFRDLVTYMTTKTSTAGDGTASAGLTLNAALARFSVAAGSAGVTKTYKLFGRGRHLISEILDQMLVADPTTGLDYRMDYATGSTRQSCQRTVTLGSPSLGVTRSHLLTEHVLASFGLEYDRERAANRVHALGQGYVKTLTNTGSLAAGDLLIEEVFDRTTVSDHSGVDNFARDARRLAQPPVKVLSASHTPGSALPFGWCDLGDVLTFAVSGPPLLAYSGTQRVVQNVVTPPQGDAPEDVAFTFNLPLDQLGA